MPEPRIYHNPRCSKSRACLQILEEQGLQPQQVRYLEQSPDRAELEWLWKRLGPEMIRQGEAIYKELNLKDASVDRVLDALLEHPILIERPIVILGDRALVARPPEKVHELIKERQ